MKHKDGAESLRIRASVAERIRQEAEELNLSFLDTLYYMVNQYLDAKYSRFTTTQRTPQVKPVIPPTPATTDDDDDTYTFDM